MRVTCSCQLELENRPAVSEKQTLQFLTFKPSKRLAALSSQLVSHANCRLILQLSRGMMLQNSMYYLNTPLMYLFITKISDSTNLPPFASAATILLGERLANSEPCFQILSPKRLFDPLSHVRYFCGL